MDTSALFAGIWSDTGGSRQILRLGEADVIRLSVGERVLDELESTLRDKAQDTLGDLTVLLDRTGIEVLDSPPKSTVRTINEHLEYRPDAEVLATAVAGEVDWFITYDRSDFLDNDPIQQTVDLRLGTAGDFLEVFKEELD